MIGPASAAHSSERWVRGFFLLLTLGSAVLTYAFAAWAIATWQAQMQQGGALGWLLWAVQTALALGAALATGLFALASRPEGDPLEDDSWCELLFRDHPKSRLRTWARSLRHFRFVRGSGGGMDDHGDCLMLALRAPTLADVDVLLRRIGARAEPPFTNPADRADGQIGESSTVLIGELRLVGYYSRGRLELSLADQADPWRVSQSTVDAAQALEERFDQLGDALIEPPQDDRHCLCPKYYPSFWHTAARAEPGGH